MTELLPTGTVTLLLADVEGSTRLWETLPEQMAAALARLNQTVTETIEAHHGVRPLEQGEGDSFVAAFARASDAVACALALQRASPAPIRLRIGVHTGEIQLRDEANYAGPTINRAARLRDLAHGGQTVLSGVTELLVIDHLPDGVWLTELGSYPLRDLPRPERVVQLCHPALRNEFPPLRVRNTVVLHNLPAQLTSFVGRRSELAQLRRIATSNRLVTLTGTGGAGKTRLSVEVAAALNTEFADGVWFIGLAPITDPVAVTVTVARALDLPDQPGRSPMDTLRHFIGEKRILLLLNNCEHLLDACRSLVVELLKACPRLTILATSREPLGVPGELTWRVPSLSITDEAVELFAERARHVRPEFVVDEDNIALVEEICQRLDGMPLAIELAAARVRALSLPQIVDSLHDRFHLLTGGARTAVPRQQTLRASMDWSHALLTEPEQVLFRRLAVFAGGFDLDAAQTVGAANDVQRYQLLDQLSLLVDKSLVAADDTGQGMRYRMLETVRQYAQERLDESGEADQVRARHRDHFAAAAAELASRGHAYDEQLLAWARAEIDNLRAAFAWSRANFDFETSLRLVLSLRPLWLRGGRALEALAELDAGLADERSPKMAPALWARAVAQRSILAAWVGVPTDLGKTQEALDIARGLDDPALLARALIARGMLALYGTEPSRPYFAEAIDLVRTDGDQWALCQIFSYQATAGCVAGEPIAGGAAAGEGLALADAIGDRFFSRDCRAWLGSALMMRGELAQASRILDTVTDEAEAAADHTMMVFGHVSQAAVLAYQGRADAAHTAARSALAASEAMGGFSADSVNAALAQAALACGDAVSARRACEMAWQHTNPLREAFTRSITPMAEAVVACGDPATARRWADDTVAVVQGWHKMVALTVRAVAEIAQGEQEQAEHDAHEALAIAARTQGYLRVADTLECLGHLAFDRGAHSHAAGLLGAAQAIRQRMGHARFPMYQAGHDAVLASVREALGQKDFDRAWATGADLSTEDAIAFAQRGHGELERSGFR
ncbi:LuxR family transcriptional regulator [Mycobacterium shinjukuense]|uniref:Transcriptional regulator n=1 Tax=Mycobacterium shinjukuense TaxID=398694 RepID=A0A7I7MMT7_9MYCO|nr:adenylate/guanylate cyclase domain-containing protein [Mycobacterium shinjukuense]MCV6984364.1 LuxR family transcriptional regulator [Mycobacterium shinjukuense]ORB70976.1 LuxR family transcriptional regulator [Mycobacterium shinjukuense]BBX73087.1 transcriptional regulator [Mycobacterium shinjukuense]